MALTILGIDPGTKQMGLAVIRGSMLLRASVHTLRNGGHPHQVIGQARSVVLSYVTKHQPEIVAVERPLLVPTKRAALVSVIVEELRGRSKDLGLRVVELSARDARKTIVGDPFAKKIDVARALVRNHFPELRSRVPSPPKRAALGFDHRDRYWLHMFDAIAVALAVSYTAPAR
jgi:Holliday junction resolvasome RuvABC endonuclease subunit